MTLFLVMKELFLTEKGNYFKLALEGEHFKKERK